MSQELYAKIREAVLEGDEDKTVELAGEAVAAGCDLQECLDEGLVAGILAVGDGFAAGDLFIPDLICGGNAVKAGAEVLKKAMEKAGQTEKSRATIVIGTAKGDVHDLGKSLVVTMFNAGGYTAIDLGVDVAPEKFVEAVKEHNAQVVGISALLTSTMPNQEATIKALEKAGIRHQVKVLVGGAPISQNWADTIHADGFAPDGTSAVALANRLLGLE